MIRYRLEYLIEIPPDIIKHQISFDNQTIYNIINIHEDTKIFSSIDIISKFNTPDIKQLTL